MIEIPETYVLSEQIKQTLTGKTIRRAVANAHPHAFAWYSGDPVAYDAMLSGKKITDSNPGTGYTCGGNTEIICEDMLLVISTPIKYHAPEKKLPAKHQLLLEFEDDSHMSCTVQMWGSMFCAPVTDKTALGHFTNTHLPDPLTDAFDEKYFDALWENTKPSYSAKAFLATEQRIPGLGNGVAQDILFNARIHPKRKLETMRENEKEQLFNSVKTTLKEMKDLGGRDTEKDLFNNSGGYRTILSKITLPHPCRVCGGGIIRQAFLGGNIYFCPTCQML
ncbi:MAG: endonuclease VIII [Clostridiales bacterium]|jgi:formamidopyrimidine-DNA glycosylase|nr:endonuclease VIII [Clostridiales bacterium]